MHAITTHLATDLLLLHMVLGCCFHHAHACDRNCCPEPATQALTCGCSDHEHAGEDPAQPDPAQPDPTQLNLAQPSRSVGDSPEQRHERHQHRCEGDHCKFVAVARTFDQRSDSHVSKRSPDGVLANREAVSPGRILPGGDSALRPSPGSLLRAQLRWRVLLI